VDVGQNKEEKGSGTWPLQKGIHPSAGWPVYVHHFNVGCGWIKLPEPIHDPPFMGVHLFEQYGLSDIVRADGRDHDELMRRAFAFAPIAVEDLDLHRLITNHRLVRRLRTTGHISIQDQHEKQSNGIHVHTPVSGSLHRDRFSGAHRGFNIAWFCVFNAHPALVQEEFRNECRHEVVKKPMNKRNQDDDNGTFIEIKGQLVRRDAHLSFG
jgi:hypothetical protein